MKFFGRCCWSAAPPRASPTAATPSSFARPRTVNPTGPAQPPCHLQYSNSDLRSNRWAMRIPGRPRGSQAPDLRPSIRVSTGAVARRAAGRGRDPLRPAGGRVRSHCRFCTTTHPLYTRFANIFGASISEATMRPDLRPERARPTRRAGCTRPRRPARVAVDVYKVVLAPPCIFH